jgi:hypothetical protein
MEKLFSTILKTRTTKTTIKIFCCHLSTENVFKYVLLFIFSKSSTKFLPRRISNTNFPSLEEICLHQEISSGFNSLQVLLILNSAKQNYSISNYFII